MADSNESRTAVEEGRRIYVGSIRYSAKPEDIEVLLATHGFKHEKIHMSIDSISARNPGYCFVELPTAEEASRALTTLDGQEFLGRPIKTGPCETKSSKPRYKSYDRNRLADQDSATQRWGDWRRGSGPRSSEGGAPLEGRELRSEQRADENAASREGRRLFVSGLPKMLNQLENDAELREFLSGFEV